MKPAATAGRAARAGALGFTVLALVLTALTAWLLSRVFGQGQYANEPLQNVVVAARDLPATEPINEDDLKIVPWPTSAVPKSAFQRKDQVLGPNARVPNALIFAGEPLLSERLASGKTGTGMAAKVPPNLRAFAVRIDAWIAQARLVYPGAVVDVVGTLKDPIDRSPVTRTVLQRLSVVAVDGNIDVVTPKDGGGEEGGRQERTAVVTVLVSPAESEILALASREGKIDIVLRNQNDDDTVETWGTNPYAILGRPNPADVLANAAALAGVTAVAPGGAPMSQRPAPGQADAAAPVRRPSSAKIRRAIQADAAASDAAARGSKTINLEAK
jgi:Flp pilus assembly protein CpaB